ncbi:hypothetical protein EJ02DRAFT_452163 [Clathrospora elynae]|uniref:2EXR domain-containing protein n=1 Tax=Clathrospora elynae TaxID=706981 RepID=A0A6A5T6Z3_9PLEO|nr:hypothetical protein EJ02DRAFT_452163 [Clathrospora elynae]
MSPSLLILPKEIRLQIWSHAYFSQPPRLVALETLPHNEEHPGHTFCPRYSPSPAPTVVNLCHESRAEARYQALKAGHIVQLPHPLGGPNPGPDLYFRFSTDILFIPLLGPRLGHYDSSPDSGLLAHFHTAIASNPTLLRSIAITKVIQSGFRDGSLSNVLREFPNISRIVMMLTEDVENSDREKELFVRAAARIVRMYKIDLMSRARGKGETFRPHLFDVEFARLRGGTLDIVSKEIWKEWSDGGDEWATLDNSEPFW